MPRFRWLCWLLLALLGGEGVAGSDVSTEAAGFEGLWTGEVVAPQGSAPFALRFSKGSKGLEVAVTMPEMFLERVPLGRARIENGTYAFPSLALSVTRHGDRLDGTFANPLLEVRLARGGALPPPLQPEPAPVGPPPVWSRNLGAEVWGSPATFGHAVYIGSVDGAVHALQAEDGAVLWRWPGRHPLYGAPAVSAESVYVVDDENDCIALDRRTGELRWRASLGKAPPGNPTFNHRTPVPRLGDGELYVGSPAGKLVVLDAATGAVRWSREVGAAVYAPVTLVGDEVWLGTFDGTVVCFSRTTHAELRRGKVGGAISSAVVPVDGCVLVGSRDYLLYGLDRRDLHVLWRDSYWFSWVESTPRVEGGVAYLGGSDFRRISAVDTATGVFLWSTDVGGLTWGTPVVTARHVFGGASAQRPAVIAHQGGIVCLDRQTGRMLWRHPLPLEPNAGRAGVLGSLAACDGRIVAACHDGTVLAFGETSP